MYRVFVGGISPEGEHLLTSYLDRFMPDTQIEPLKAAGIKGKMKNHATRQDVLMVILDDLLWNSCVGVVDSVLELPKVHRYESDDGLREFLIERFGPLEADSTTGVIPPDMLIAQSAEEDEYIPKAADLSKDSSTGDTVPPDSLSEPVMVDDELPTTEESEDVVATAQHSEIVEKLESKVRDLQSTLAGKETLIRSLTQQLDDKKAGDDDDIAAMAGRIRELESIVAEKDAQLSNSDNDNFVNLGKVARAEQVLGEFEDLRQQAKQVTEEREAVTKERDALQKKLEGLEAEATGLREQVAEIPNLRKDIADRETKIGVLEQQIADTSAVIVDLKAEKAELETASADAAGVAMELAQLKSEVEVLQQQIDADKEKLARLDDAEEELSAKQLEIDNLNADIRALNEKLDTQRSDIEQIREDLQEKTSELEATKKSLEEVRNELHQKSGELDEVARARDEALSKLNNSDEYTQSLVESTQDMSQRITELTDEVAAKGQRIDALMFKLQDAEASITGFTQQLEDIGVELKSKSNECDELSNKLSATEGALSDKTSEAASLSEDLASTREELSGVRNSLDEKTGECTSLSEQLSGVRQELEGKTAECSGLTQQLEELKKLSSSSMDEVKTHLVEKDTEITDLRGKLTVKDGTITKLTADIADLHEKLTAANGEVVSTREQLGVVRKQLLDAQSASNEASISAETQKQALEKLIQEKGELEDKLVAAEGRALELDSRIKSLEDELSQERSYRGSVDDSNVELTAQNEKLSNTIKQLEEGLVRAKADEDMVARLENDLLEERRRSARLQSEVEVMKKTSGSDKASDLRLEVVRLKKELADLQSSTVDASDAKRLEVELADARERNAQLELDIVAKEQEARAAQSSVFAQLQNIAIPKSVYDFRFGGVAQVSDKFVCMVSGSEESTANVYQVLRSSCNADQNKRVLIIDLVTDSSIDREFGIKKIVSPIDWLAGKAPFNQYIAATRFGNVKVLSTALAYINDLFLLTVDWQARLAELEAFSADTVVLYVGCLNNLVTKVLFDMLSRAMRTYVVVKATPVNLRTTILNLTGFKELSPSVTVECVNFSDTSSASMYQRLTAKYKAQILRETEVLKL